MRTIESSKLTRIALKNLKFLRSKSMMMAAKFCQARWMSKRMELSGLHGVESEHHNIQENLEEVQSAQHRSFCLSSDKTNGLLRFLETRPLPQDSRCSPTKMNPYFPICVSTALFGGESNKEGDSRQNIDYISIAVPTMAPNAPKSGHKESSPFPKLANHAKKILRESFIHW